MLPSLSSLKLSPTIDARSLTATASLLSGRGGHGGPRACHSAKRRRDSGRPHSCQRPARSCSGRREELLDRPNATPLAHLPVPRRDHAPPRPPQQAPAQRRLPGAGIEATRDPQSDRAADDLTFTRGPGEVKRPDPSILRSAVANRAPDCGPTKLHPRCVVTCYAYPTTSRTTPPPTSA